MKKLVLFVIAFTAIAFQSNAIAQTCVPTSTVEQARAEYEQGLQQISANLRAEDLAAKEQLRKDYAVSQENYAQRVKEIDAQYESEIAQIRRDLNPGWDRAIEDAAARHNEALNLAAEEYHRANDLAVVAYNQATDEARVRYNQEAQRLAAEYNRAVCAGQ